MVLVYRVVDLSSELIRQEARAKLIYVVNRHPKIKMLIGLTVGELLLKILMLGGGLAGISCSYHLGHNICMIIERNSYLGGHPATHRRDSAFWDEGPHVSFTKHSEVRELLNWSAGGDVLDYPTNVGNYFARHWIPHPAQSHLHADP